VDRVSARKRLAVGRALPTPEVHAGGERREGSGVIEACNIIVIANEAHRKQYDLIDKLARNLRDSLPNASFIGFTGTPIEKTDANTRAVFGDYVSIYDIQRAVADKATVPICYESRVSPNWDSMRAKFPGSTRSLKRSLKAKS
jgi:type I site-specific restriction-modification system R (restriction) subunit